MAAQVRIDFRIGGVDAAARAFLSVSQAAERAIRKSVSTERSVNRERAAEARRTSNQLIGEQRRVVSEERKLAREAVSVVRQANREKLAEERRQSREVVAVVRAANRDKAREEREGHRLAVTRRRALVGAVGGAVGGAADGVRTLGRGAGAVIRGGMGLAGSMLGGAGIEVGLGHAIKGKIQREKLSTNLINSSLSGPEAENVSAADRKKRALDLSAHANNVGNMAAMDPNEVLEGMAKFVSKTGDLQSARDTVADLAILSRATGTNMGDMVDAAGDVAANLGDVPNKGQAIVNVMRAIAGQGKLGAVEVKDLAKQMAGLAAQAGQFAGDPAQTMGALGALAQESRQRGGSKSAAQAVTSVQSFVGTFSKGARRKELDSAFKSVGAKYENDQGQLLDPEEIIVNALKATKGDKAQMGKLFMDTRARSVTRGFETIYSQKGGGEAGEAAVREEFKRLKEASMGKGDTEEAFKASMDTMEAKAQLFQQRIDQIAGDLADKLIPAFLTLVPVIEKGVPVLNKFVEDVAKHGPAIADAADKLVPKFAEVADVLAKMIGAAVNNPEIAGAVIAAGAFRGALGSLAGSLGSLVSSSAGASAALASFGSALLPVLAILGLGAAAGKAIDQGIETGNDSGREYSETSRAGNLARKIRSGQASPDEIEHAKGLAEKLEMRGLGGGEGVMSVPGRMLGRAAASSLDVMENVKRDGFSLSSLGHIAGFLPTMMTAATTGDSNASASAAGAAEELKAALSGSPMKLEPGSKVALENPEAIGAAIAGPVGEAVSAAIASSGLQRPGAQPPGP